MFILENIKRTLCSSMVRWKLLDFAELKRSSISFFDIKKPETAMSRWSRARTRAAKVSFKSYSYAYYCIMLLLFSSKFALFYFR